MTSMRWGFGTTGTAAAAITAGLSGMSACYIAPAECEEEPPQVTVSAEENRDEYRALPVLESGAQQLLGIDLPDSHAHLAVEYAIDGVDDVEITSLGVELEVGGEPVDVSVERRMKNDEDVEVGDTLWSGERIRYYLRVPGLDELAQPVGESFTATFSLGWRRDFGPCGEQTGTETFEVEGAIASVVDAGSFELVAEPAPTAAEPSTVGGADFHLAAEVTSGLTVEIADVRGTITYFGEENLAGTTSTGLALVALSDLATQVDDEHTTTIDPGDTLEIFTSSDPEASPAPRDFAGSAASVGSLAGGRAVVVLEIDYEPTDGTSGLETDILATVVDLE